MVEAGEKVYKPTKLSEQYLHRRIGTSAAEIVEKHLLPDYMRQVWLRNARLWDLHDQKEPAFDEELTGWITEIRDGDGQGSPGLIALRGDPETDPHVSIVIPALNEERYILQLLSSISSQYYDRGVEVIVMDNDSSDTDRTASIAEQCGAKVHKYTIPEDDPRSEESQIALARQRGLKEDAIGDIVISTDSDVIVPHDWIVAMTSPLDNDPGVGVVTGGIAHYDRPEHYLIYFKDVVSKTVRRYQTAYYNIRKHGKTIKSPTWGANMAYRRSDALAIGGYNTSLMPSEDSDLGHRLVASRAGKTRYINNEQTKVRVSPRRYEGRGRAEIAKVLIGLQPYQTLYKNKSDQQIVKR